MGALSPAEKAAAKRLGVTFAAYQRRLERGHKWCTGCKDWHPREEFPRDRTRGDGLRAYCLAAVRGRPRWPRDPLHEKARKAVATAVRNGLLPPANSVPCHDCGHYEKLAVAMGFAPERRHEYDHVAGYAPEHHLDVEVVCTVCHADRESRRGLRQKRA